MKTVHVLSALLPISAVVARGPSLPDEWRFEGDLVGELPSCERVDSFCVKRCYGRDTILESCCEQGTWAMNTGFEVCDNVCDQIDGAVVDDAECTYPGKHEDLFADILQQASDLAFQKTQEMKQSKHQPLKVTVMPSDLKVVFLGDGDTAKESSFDVYAAAAEWGPDMVIYNADMDYRGREASPDGFFESFDGVFGADMPMFATIGNHDFPQWFEDAKIIRGRSWEVVLKERYNRLGMSEHCQGVVGINNVCHYKGLLMVESGVGLLSFQTPERTAEYVNFIDESFAPFEDAAWKMCTWHYNQRELQLCNKYNAVGYDAYEMCRKYGAIINNAHEHSYARTHTMTDLSGAGNLSILDNSNNVTLDKGQSMVFVLGASGASIRGECDGFGDRPWWAAWAAGNGNKGTIQDASVGTSHGFKACTFRPGGVANRADCFYQDKFGRKFDEYSMFTNMDTCPGGSLAACLDAEPDKASDCEALCA